MEEKNTKTINKKYLILGVIILIVCIFTIFIYNKYDTPLNNYKKQAITTLKQYKSGEVTKKEAKEKLDAVSDKLSSEYEVQKESKVLSLEVKISYIAYKLIDKELSDTEIEKYIEEIKNE